MASKALPTVAAGSLGLSRYLEEIRKFPMLEPGEEYMLAKRWQEHQDKEAAEKLVTSHLRLVARIAMGANPQQALLAFREAEAYNGPALILSYSHCIAHGINMQHGLDQQFKAVHSGYWPLMRYNPTARQSDENPFVLDSPRPTLKLRDYTDNELRYRMLRLTNPKAADQLMQMAQAAVDRKWKLYEEMAALG